MLAIPKYEQFKEIQYGNSNASAKGTGFWVCVRARNRNLKNSDLKNEVQCLKKGPNFSLSPGTYIGQNWIKS